MSGERAARELRAKQVRQMYGSGNMKTEWGVLLDDAGSTDMYGSRAEAAEMFVAGGGLGLVCIKVENCLPPTRCEVDTGSRPGWMSPDQYERCPCVLDFAHEGPHACSCDSTSDVTS